MAIISRIRKRAGLIVTLIGVALFSFVLSDLLFSGKSLLSSEQNAGEIAGNKISLVSFDNQVQVMAEIKKEQNRQPALGEEEMNAIRDNIWEKLIQEIAINPQLNSAGISVSDKEMQELILGNNPDPLVSEHFTDRNTHKLYPFFVDPSNGKINPRSIKTYVDSLPAQEKFRWTEFENFLHDIRAQDKYLNIIKKGLYVTKEQAKQAYAELNKSVGFKYIVKPYSTIADSAIKINEQDLLNYYNANSYKYKQESSRKLEYIVYDIKPTELDFSEVKNDMSKIETEWKEIKSHKEDSLFVIREADTRIFDTTYYGKGKLPSQIDSLSQASESGTVLPMYMENETYKITKVLGHTMTPDSVKARHILIKVPQGDSLSKAKVKTKIDSILSIIKKKKNFGEMAKKFSEDAGSKDTGGVLGWFTTGRMVPEFQNACFNGKKGEMPIVLSQFGYHLIEIQDQSPLTKKTAITTIDRKVEPGTKTRQDVYNKAVDFITKYPTSDLFNQGVEKEHVIKRVADPLKENDKIISGIENPRDIIRWAFKSEKGEICKEPFNVNAKYVITHLAEIRNEGIAPLEQIKKQVEFGAKKSKKAEQFIAEFEKVKSPTIEEYGSKLNLSPLSVESVSFSSNNIPKVGRELNLYGSLFTLNKNEISKPIEGETGVYVIKLESITPEPTTTDYTASKEQATRNYLYRTEQQAMEAIKKNAKIVDNRAKFF